MKYSKSVQFREAQEKDISDLLEVIRQGQVLGTPSFDVAHIENYKNLLKIIQKSDCQFLYVVIEEEIVVATFQLYVLFNFANGTRPDIHIENFFVKESHRSMGIGKLILEWIVSYAKNKKAKRIQLTTNQKRIRAREFYLKNGFVDSHVGMKFHI